jgi:hypothetical protein
MFSTPAICGENVWVSEPGSNQASGEFAHRLCRMSGRDPHESHRSTLRQLRPVALMW